MAVTLPTFTFPILNFKPLDKEIRISGLAVDLSATQLFLKERPTCANASPELGNVNLEVGKLLGRLKYPVLKPVK